MRTNGKTDRLLDTIQKMTWMTYGNQLHMYLGDDIPKEYGGTGAPLQEHALTPRYDGASTQHAEANGGDALADKK